MIRAMDISDPENSSVDPTQPVSSDRFSDQGLSQILGMTETLLQCDDLDELCRRAVELPREKFGFRRTGLYLLEASTGKFRSTFGTDIEGKTRDERGCAVEKDFFSSQLNLLRDGHLRWHLEPQVDIGHFEMGKFKRLGSGWVVATPIYLGNELQGCFFNDEGGSDNPCDHAKQEILAVYCNTLGSLIREKQANAALRASQEQYRLLFDESPEAMVVYSTHDFAILAANRVAQEQYGYSEEEFLRLKWTDLEWKELEEHSRALTKQNGIEDRTAQHHRSDGKIFTAALRSHEILFGNWKARLNLLVDVSARVKAEQAVERMANFPRFNPNPVIEFSKSGELLYQNDAVREMLSDFHYIKLVEILPGDYETIIMDCLETERAVLRQEVKVMGKTLSWSFFPIAAIGVVHCYGGDITEKIQLEEQLRQAQKMESVGQLAGGVAHDFNNILTAVLGYVEYLQDLPEIGHDGQTACQELKASVRRAADLTKQLLLYSKKSVATLATFDLNDALRDVQSMLGRLIGEQIRLDCKTSHEILPVAGDAAMIGQVLTNLVVNARDAMPKGGTLVLETGGLTIDNESDGMAHWIFLKVKDSGEGMDERTREKIFEPFFSTKPLGRGTGLGLSTVYAIVRQHGGRIEVKSALGEGSTFTVLLPRSEGRLDSRMPTPRHKGPSTIRKAKILMIEDEELVRKLARRMLTALGMEVVEAEHGPQALELWKEQCDQIDVLFTDMVMPQGLSGKALALRMLKDKPDLKVILTSGYSFDLAESEDALPPAALYLPKPYSMQDLTVILGKVLDKSELKENFVGDGS